MVLLWHHLTESCGDNCVLRVEAAAAQHVAEQAAVSQVRSPAAAARAQAGHAARRLLLHLGRQLSPLAAALLRHARAGCAGASPSVLPDRPLPLTSELHEPVMYADVLVEVGRG